MCIFEFWSKSRIFFQCRKNKSPHRNRNPLFSDPVTPIYLQMIEYQASGLLHCLLSSCVPLSANRTSKLGFESTDCQYLEYSCSLNALPLQKAARLVIERTARDPCPFAHHWARKIGSFECAPYCFEFNFWGLWWLFGMLFGGYESTFLSSHQ